MGGGDPRIGGSSVGFQTAPPTIDNEQIEVEKERLPQTAKSSEDAKSPTPAKAEKNSSPAKLAELNLRGQLQQMNLRSTQFPTSSPLFSSQTTPSANVGAVNQPSKTTDVRALQESLNKWRAETGQGAINLNGVLDKDTEGAISQFQFATGLNVDGKPNVDTQKRLTLALNILNKQPQNSAMKQDVIKLLGSSGFRSLGEPGQSKTLNQALNYAKSPATAKNVELLKNLITEPGFDQLSPQSKDHMLRILATHAGDANISKNLSEIAATPNFRNLDPGTQNVLLKRLERYGSDSTKIENLKNVITNTDKFAELPKETRDFLIRSHMNHPDNALLGESLRRATNSQNFRNMPRPMQMEVLNHVSNYPPGELGHVDNLMELMTTPKFQDLPLGIKDQILASLPNMYQDVKLDAAKIRNLMKLASAPGFEKVDDRIREEMLGVLALRPDNVQLAEELENLANSAKFRHDHRNARKTIMEVNDRIQ